jgi:phage-related minor tail protein
MTQLSDGLNKQTEQLRRDMEDLNRLADSFGTRLVYAFSQSVIQGRKLSDTLKGLAFSLAGSALTQALRPLGNLVGGLFAGVIGSGRGSVVRPFANGGIVNSPTLFPLRGGAGLMGEAGPEAVLPLARGSDGRLGVRGAGGVNVTVNITTPDARSFERSQSQVAALMARAVSRGQRNL